ncbi:5-oxoprolinase subunit PxpA [Cellulomonas shaoxiangyii]|uniref:5-oxoprolinase subunit PxpA n=1 Tax=Cellulomonas shaoxiangyii TaxID=2566013 RepID=A0A4P7SJY5_9CELL|nr:5-oxoprolinase subunit PxpA [Cellulomonas shaoxiangyii]QCB94151.1 5-oxoprolinase subunit PxpA [Cellulomonas shaoxiangyii]TGY86644.1 5-oxoprolinase subunit PxpA [Cellulomonas shaoxiangyii]
MTRRIDLNCDLGESFGIYRHGADEEMMPLITSANVACGFHAGDPVVMHDAVASAAAHGVAVGAHVGLPDRLGFGRRYMQLSAREAYASTVYQLGALGGFLAAAAVRMQHVKPHGALYMMAAEDADVADAVAAATAAYDARLAVYTLPGSQLAVRAQAYGLAVVEEFFADRPYGPDGVQMFGWTYDQLGGPAGTADRVAAMLADPAAGSVETVCVHSDTDDAPALVRAVRDRLHREGVTIGRAGTPDAG